MPVAFKSNDSTPRHPPWFVTEQLITLAQAARLLPPLRDGKPGEGKCASPSTVYRWGDKGRQSQVGLIVKLDVHRVGGTNCTSIEALERFFRALNDKDDHDDSRDEDDGFAIGALRPRNPPKSPGSRVKASVARRNQYQEALKVLGFRGYLD